MTAPMSTAAQPQSPQVDRDPVGTTYQAPDGAFYRIRCYETPIRALLDDKEDEQPVYDYWAPSGGAASGITTLPDGSVRVVLPAPARPAVGSLFVSPDGTAYRLRGYRQSLRSSTETPSYAVLLPEGRYTTTEELPADARLVWAPEAGTPA